jgi:hypothetical protein
LSLRGAQRRSNPARLPRAKRTPQNRISAPRTTAPDVIARSAATKQSSSPPPREAHPTEPSIRPPHHRVRCHCEARSDEAIQLAPSARSAPHRTEYPPPAPPRPMSWRGAQRRSHPAYFSPRVSRRSSVSTPQPISPNFPTADAPEQTRIKTGNWLHLRGESFAAPIRIFVARPRVEPFSGSGSKDETASRKVRPYREKKSAVTAHRAEPRSLLPSVWDPGPSVV